MKACYSTIEILNPNFIAIALMICFSPTLLAQELATFSSEYSASANGIKAKASRKLQRLADGSYLFENTLTAEFAGAKLATLIETSKFQMSGESISPADYQYSLTGISDDSRAITFDWPTSLASSTEAEKKWQVKLKPNTQDPLSYQLALPQQLAKQASNVIEIPIIDAGKIEIQRFQIIGEEDLESPIGRLNCVIVERVRQNDDSRTTTIWFAKNYSYLLAKLEQTTASGLSISLELETANIGN